MLTLQLRELETDGLIARRVNPQVSPKVECYLTLPALHLIRIFEKSGRLGR
jgi:DNA-binding HxlR family transcriptional regulator